MVKVVKSGTENGISQNCIFFFNFTLTQHQNECIQQIVLLIMTYAYFCTLLSMVAGTDFFLGGGGNVPKQSKCSEYCSHIKRTWKMMVLLPLLKY